MNLCGAEYSGKNVNEFTAMQTTAVYACVRILAESVASLPLHVYEYKGQGKRYFVKFNVDGLLRGDYQSRMAGYAVGRPNGWLSANDIREMENMNPISEAEGGNLYLINGNLCKLRDAGLFGKQNGTT